LALIEQLVGHASQEPQTLQLRVLPRELPAPTSHLQTFFLNEALPQVAPLRRMLAEIIEIPAEDPALTRCLLCVIAPGLMLLVGGRSFPGPLQEVFQMPSQAIASHLYHYAIGGLKTISREYAMQATPPAKPGSPRTR